MGRIQNFFSGLFNERANSRYEVFQIGEPGAFDFGGKGKVINGAYGSNSDVYSIVKRVASIASKIPRELDKINKKGEWENVTEGDLHKIVTKQPNPKQNIVDFNEESLTNLLLKGEIFRQGKVLPGFGNTYQDIYVLNNTTVKVDCVIENFRPVPSKYTIIIDGKSTTLTAEEVNHVMYYNPMPSGLKICRGLSPLEAGFLPLISSSENKKAQSVMVRNGATRGLLTSRSNENMDEQQREQLQKASDQRMEGAVKFGKVLTTSANVDYVKMGLDPSQLKMLESAIVSKRDLCDLYGVDSSLFNDPANKTYNNRKEAEKAMWTNAIIPANEKDILGLSEWLLPAYNERDNTTYRIRQNLQAIPTLHEDEVKKSTKQKNVSSIIITTLAAQITREQKIQSLAISLDVTEEEATKIVGNA